MLTLKLLGTPSIETSDGPAAGRAAQGRQLALLALLALARGRAITRDKLLALLWPESPSDRARRQLSDVVYIIRSALGDDVIRSAGDELVLNAQAVTSDVATFEQFLDDGRTEDAVGLVAGPLLDGFHLSGAAEFEHWLDAERARLGQRYAAALESMAAASDTRGDFAAAVKWWRKLAAQDPYSGRVVLRLMRSLEAAGDRAGALQHARVHAILLREEFDAAPDPDVVALAEQLRVEPPARARRQPPPAVQRPSPEVLEPDAALSSGVAVPSTAKPSPLSRSRRSRRPLAVAAVAVMALAALAARLWLAQPSTANASVAVLPFVNMGGDQNDDYFSDGMTEELIHALAGVAGLRVTARTSAFQFKGQNIDVRQVGRRLGVASVLEGSVRRSGTRLRITVQLVSTTDGAHLWSDAYDRELEDALAVQEEIARSIVRTLRPRLTGTASLVTRHSEDHEAYQLYLKARHALSQRTPATLKQAIDYFEQAIARDPDYALAHSGLADAHARLYDIAGRAPGELVPRIRAAAQRALGLDSTLAEPYALLGWIHTHEWEWAEAEAAFERAIELDPNSPDTYLDYSTYLDNRGRFEEALEVCLFARELDPLSPRVAYNVAGSYLHLAQFEPAIKEARAMIALDPTLPLGYDALGWALVDSGRPGEAIQPLERAVTLGGGRWLALSNLGRAYAGVGRGNDARTILARLERDWGDTGFGNFAMAAVHLALGERGPALQRLEQVYRLRYAKLPHLRQWSAFEPLYQDPDFLRIVREAGF